jgi:hypothetical protein
VRYLTGILPSGTPLFFINALIVFMLASCGAGGLYDVLKNIKTFA